MEHVTQGRQRNRQSYGVLVSSVWRLYVDPRDQYLPLSDPTVTHANQRPKGCEPILPSINVCFTRGAKGEEA